MDIADLLTDLPSNEVTDYRKEKPERHGRRKIPNSRSEIVALILRPENCAPLHGISAFSFFSAPRSMAVRRNAGESERQRSRDDSSRTLPAPDTITDLIGACETSSFRFRARANYGRVVIARFRARSPSRFIHTARYGREQRRRAGSTTSYGPAFRQTPHHGTVADR